MSEPLFSSLGPAAASAESAPTTHSDNTPPQDWKAATELICRSNRILLICHVSPDGDAIGSLLGLGLGLRVLDKTVVLACESPPPFKFSYLPGFETIVDQIDEPSPQQAASAGAPSPNTKPFDLIIGLDSSDKARLGNIYDAKRFSGLPLINIDHHVTNLFFGDVNLVDPKAASTAEVVLTLLEHLDVSIEDDKGIANCLLTGIVTDTLGFRTSNVTPQVMKAAMRLMEAGASLSMVTHHAFHQRPVTELCLLARGLSHLRTENGLGWSEITLVDRHECGHKGNGDVGLAGMLARTQEIHISAVFTEKENNQVEISFRADPGYDVAQVALSLGGGGHPAASGCTVDGPLENAQARVLPMLRAALAEQQKALRKAKPQTS